MGLGSYSSITEERDGGGETEISKPQVTSDGLFAGTDMSKLALRVLYAMPR